MHLQGHLKLSQKVCESLNLTDQFSEQDLEAIGEEVWRGYEEDERSRVRWMERTQAAMDLAMQLQTAKTFPWPGCANVRFPLVTIAALQWHSRAYPALLGGPEIVKCKTFGLDEDGSKKERAERIAAHMSFQVTEEDEAWEEDSDRGFLSEAIVGCMFKKSWFKHSAGHNRSEFVQAKDLCMNYYARSVEDCSRKTHMFPLSRNDIHERVGRTLFRDVSREAWLAPPPPVTEDLSKGVRVDVRKGQTPPTPDEQTPFQGLEQHVSLDLDGDGYAEPYIITITKENHVPLRIVTRFEWEHVEWSKDKNPRVVSIRALEHFTKYGFIPSPDGSVYDIGFGILLGPLNESVNSAINQIFDSGTMQTTAGGFLGRGVRIRGGENSFRPFGWNRVDSTGDDLNKNIVPLPVREPSQVLFALLTFLVDYTNRIAGTVDVMVGENPGQNTPKYNMQAMIQEGQRIYNAIFKRQWRCMKEEFRKLWILNATYLPVYATTSMGGIKISREDYKTDPRAIRPAADPNLTSDNERLQQAVMLKQAAMMGGYDKDAVEMNFLRAIRIDTPKVYYKGLKEIPPPPPPHVAGAMLKAQADGIKVRATLAEKLLEVQEKHAKTQAEIKKLEAEVAKILSEVGTERAALLVKAFDAQVDALKDVDEMLRSHIEQLLGQVQQQGDEGAQAGRVPGMAGSPGHSAGLNGSTPAGGSVSGSVGAR